MIAKRAGALLLCALFLLFAEHGALLAQVPGLHFDEAWAANFSFDIAFRPHFWPLHAMSPYTKPWAHYLAALFFRLFGAKLFVFRASQSLLSLLGLGFLALALWREGKKEAARLFLLLSALLPALALNHRFAIELNGFHALCFGLFYFLYRGGHFLPALLTAAFGITSHILFLAPALAVLGERILLEQKIGKKERWLWICWSLGFVPYFWLVARQIPESGKAYSLVALMLILAFFLLFQGERLARHARKWLYPILILVALPFLWNLLFFSAGEWTLALTTGRVSLPWATAGGVMLCIAFALWRERGQGLGFLLCLVLSGLMMLKPAPRYFECSLLWLLLLLAQSISSLPRLQRAWLLAALALNSILVFGLYFTQSPVEREIHFLFWKDNSRDFLSKQELARALGLAGCRLSDIKSVDSRVHEALLFLDHSDWPASSRPCPWKEIVVAHANEAKPERAMNLAGFWFWGAEWKQKEK